MSDTATHLALIILGSITILLSPPMLVIGRQFQGRPRQMFKYGFYILLACGIMVLIIGLTTPLWQ